MRKILKSLVPNGPPQTSGWCQNGLEQTAVSLSEWNSHKESWLISTDLTYVGRWLRNCPLPEDTAWPLTPWQDLMSPVTLWHVTLCATSGITCPTAAGRSTVSMFTGLLHWIPYDVFKFIRHDENVGLTVNYSMLRRQDRGSWSRSLTLLDCLAQSWNVRGRPGNWDVYWYWFSRKRFMCRALITAKA